MGDQDSKGGRAYEIYDGETFSPQDVLRHASRALELDPDHRKAFNLLCAMERDGRGRMVVMEAPHGDEWSSLLADFFGIEDEQFDKTSAERAMTGRDDYRFGPIGVVLPTSREVNEVVVVLITGDVLVLAPYGSEPDGDDDEAGSGERVEQLAAFQKVFYPNSQPITIKADDISEAVVRFLESRAPHYDGSVIPALKTSKHREFVEKAFARALETMGSVDFHAIKAAEEAARVRHLRQC